MAVSIPPGAALRRGKPDHGIQVQKGGAEGMTMREGAVRLLVYQVIPLFSPFSKSSLLREHTQIDSFHLVTSPQNAGQMYW